MAVYQVGTGKTYATIQAAIDAIPGNLSGQGIQTVEIYAGGASNIYNGFDAYSGFIGAGASDYIHAKGMISHRGITGAGIMMNTAGYESAATALIVYMVQYSRISEIELKGLTSSKTVVGIEIATSYGRVNSLLIHDLTTSAGASSVIGINGRPNMLISNNMLWNLDAPNTVAGSVGIQYQANSECYNNSVYKCTAPSGYAWGVRSRANNTKTKNNISMDNGNFDFKWNGGETAANTDYNCSSDNSADDRGATHALINKAAANQFVNATAGSEDLHLKAGADCLSAGTDLSGTFTDDIDGDTRSNWDVGADEKTDTVASPPPFITQPIGVF